MSNLDASDLLDGSDVDEDNVGDVDQDVENVLLGSDDDEVTTAQHHVTTRGNKFSYNDGGGLHSEEEEDVLNLGAEGEEEPLDFEADPGQEGGRRVQPVQVRNSAAVRGSDHTGDDRLPSGSSYDENIAANEDFSDRRYVEEDDYEDDEEEDRTTRSRFTSERKVESFNSGHMVGTSNSVGIPIQTVGDRNKVKQGLTEGRPKHWNHHNGPRHMGPRHPGRNQRFPNSPRPGLGEHPHMRGHMNQPIVQFNEGLFTDFNQPMRHPHPRLRPPPPGRFEAPRLQEMGPHHRHPMHPHDPNNMRPNFGPHNNRPFFSPNENRFGPPRLPQPPGNMIHPQHQSPPVQPRPDFNLRGPRPPRFSPNNFNHRSPRPPQGMNSHPNPQMERPLFPPRQHHPHYDQPPPSARDLANNRPPNPQGFPPPPHNGPPGFAHPNINPPPPRFMGPRPPMEAPPMPFYNQEQMPNYHQGPESGHPPYHHEGQWNGPPEQMTLPNQSPWMQQQQQQQQQNFGGPSYSISNMYDQSVRPPNTGMIYSGTHMIHQANHPQMSLTLHASHQMEIPPITKSIYIKPNSEIHEAISKGQLRHHIKDDDRRYHESTASSSKHYDDHYRDREHRDRERSSSSRRESSPSDRRRDGDYHDERRSYHQHEDKRPRRKYEDDRRHRSESPDKKIIRSDRQQDSIDRKKEKEREADKKEADKLLEEAKKMGLGEDYVKKLEEQRKLRERILKTKEQRRKQVKVPTDGDVDKDSKSLQTKDSSRLAGSSSKTMASGSNLQKGCIENAKEIEADSTVATAKSGKPKKILRIVRDKSGKIISRKVHVVLVAKPQQEGQQSTSTS